MGGDGLPALGYAEVLRSPVWDLCREVTKLRTEVDALQSELAALRSGVDNNLSAQAPRKARTEPPPGRRR